MTQGAIDGLSGFIAQLAILVVAFATGTVSFDLSATSLGDVNWQVVLAVVLLVFVAALVALWRVRRLRQRVLPVLRSAWSALRGADEVAVPGHRPLRDPAADPADVGTHPLDQPSTPWGHPLGLMACTLVVVTTSLFQGIVPVPGGIGVSEALMVGLLVPLGALPATRPWRPPSSGAWRRSTSRRQRASSPPGGSNGTATSDRSRTQEDRT